ncbi:MAG: non-heme iron protein, hemerythrin family [Sulfurimonas sp.]|nr:MAG: non-heme iron protein, hemerythrin family [Sulfurimonas sp.]
MEKDEKIHWNEKYKIGIKSVDSQHKKLFMLVNRLYDLNEATTSKEEVRSILYDFSTYMQTHFDEEEEFMRSIKYNKLEEHKQLHQNLVDNLASIIKTHATLNIIKSKMKIISKRALIAHIVKEDTKIIDFINNNEMKLEITDLDTV